MNRTTQETSVRHPNYHLLNLLGYGLAKFGESFVKEFNFDTKTALYQHLVALGVCQTVNVVKNRQDLFDPFFPQSGRRGWWQNGDAYKHRKDLIDEVYGSLNCHEFAEMIKAILPSQLEQLGARRTAAPIAWSMYNRLKDPNFQAETFFIHHYAQVDLFNSGKLKDARALDDGYDFQIDVSGSFFVVEVKGLPGTSGSVIFTKEEYDKAKEYRDDYVLAVVTNLDRRPQIVCFIDPTQLSAFQLVKQTIEFEIEYRAPRKARTNC